MWELGSLAAPRINSARLVPTGDAVQRPDHVCFQGVKLSNADELPGSSSSSTERGKARRFLLGIPGFCLGLTLLVLDSRVHVKGLLGLTFLILPLALTIGSVKLQRSRPQGMGKVLTPRTLRRIARIADVPEPGTMIVVYGCLIAAVGVAFLSGDGRL